MRVYVDSPYGESFYYRAKPVIHCASAQYHFAAGEISLRLCRNITRLLANEYRCAIGTISLRVSAKRLFSGYSTLGRAGFFNSTGKAAPGSAKFRTGRLTADGLFGYGIFNVLYAVS
jgi:hypothetical protein